MKIINGCGHSVCGETCNLALPPESIPIYERQRPLWDIEKSCVRVGQRYRSWQHGTICRIVATGLSTHLGHLTAMVAFEEEETRVTYFKTLAEFTDHIGNHKRWEMIDA
jgi:hypothetical protein